jgi:thioredoxin reductase (NADPH)
LTHQRDIYDITIIGGGPTGLFTAFYAGIRQAKVKVIESLPQLGGQLTALYPEKYIYDVAGFPKIRSQELVDNLKIQMQQFEPTLCLEESVEQLEKQADDSFKLTTNRNIHYSKTIIITAGNGAFRPRKLELEGAAKFEQVNLHYFVKDMNRFTGKKVAVLGGGDSAIDWALMLEPIAEKVIVIHRRDKFRAQEHSIENLMKSSIEVRTPYLPIELKGNDSINQIVIKQTKDEQIESIDVDDVIVNYGFVSSLGPMKDWGLMIEKNAIVVNSKQETSLLGVYAAGDVCTYDGKVKLIVTGFGEGPTAVNNAKAYMDPKAKVQPLHSTSLFS